MLAYSLPALTGSTKSFYNLHKSLSKKTLATHYHPTPKKKGNLIDMLNICPFTKSAQVKHKQPYHRLEISFIGLTDRFILKKIGLS